MLLPLWAPLAVPGAVEPMENITMGLASRHHPLNPAPVARVVFPPATLRLAPRPDGRRRTSEGPRGAPVARELMA